MEEVKDLKRTRLEEHENSDEKDAKKMRVHDETKKIATSSDKVVSSGDKNEKEGKDEKPRTRRDKKRVSSAYVVLKLDLTRNMTLKNKYEFVEDAMEKTRLEDIDHVAICKNEEDALRFAWIENMNHIHRAFDQAWRQLYNGRKFLSTDDSNNNLPQLIAHKLSELRTDFIDNMIQMIKTGTANEYFTASLEFLKMALAYKPIKGYFSSYIYIVKDAPCRGFKITGNRKINKMIEDGARMVEEIKAYNFQDVLNK